MPAYERNKGAEGERELVRRLKAIGMKAERRVRNYKGEPDIDLYPPRSQQTVPLLVQVKRRKRLPKSMKDWMEGSDIVFAREDRGEWVAIMPWKTFEDLVK